MIDPFSLVFLLPLIFLAGFIDSIAGGGGLVSLASYYAVGLPPATVLGNNKFSSTFGTIVSVWNYGKSGKIYWPIAAFASVFTIAGSHFGAVLALRYSDFILSYLLLVTLPFITALVIVPRRKDGERREIGRPMLFAFSAVLAAATGLYDGFFGPGTGMFLTIGFSMLGFTFLESAGITKVINAASNVSALITFMISGSIVYQIGIPAALFSIAGNALGSRFALRYGDRAIKPLLIVVIVLLYINIIMSLL